VISIVDDDLSVREAARSLVRSLGHSAVTYSSAEEFLSSGRVDTTECVISDVHMPGLSGMELQARLIADGHHTPMIFMTANPDEKLRGRVLKAGAIGYLTKPFKEDDLIECLDAALRSGSSRAA
jgi:FixJ family two-component response regulator